MTALEAERFARATALRAATDTVGVEYSTVLSRRSDAVVDIAKRYEDYILHGSTGK